MTTAHERLAAALADRYRIERELGQGGMATVYLAHDEKHDRKVAIKVLKPELAAVLGAERFVVEIKTTAALQHPHILPLFDSGTADGFLFYVMPYIQGETIREKLNRETQFGVDDAVRIAREVADALDYAHRHGVIHRDIKPENILLHDGRAMVMDFGIALAVSAAAGGRMTETGLSLGTPHYMSPEQATAEKDLSSRADEYSLATVLYEMLSGNPPHTGATAQQIIMKIITEPAAPVTSLRKSVPVHVAAALAKALEKLPADRFESVKAFADALVNPSYAGDTAVHAGSGATVRRMPKRWTLVAATVALLAVGGAIGAALMYRTPVQPPVVRFLMTMPGGQRLGYVTRWDTPFAISPDGKYIAYSATDSGASTTNLHVRALDQFNATSIPGTDNAGLPFFSPDGLWIGFVTLSDRTMRKVALAGGPVSVVVGDVGINNGTPSWGDDHSIVYVNNAHLYRVGDGGGTPTLLADSLKTPFPFAPQVLPGSRTVLFASIDRGNRAGSLNALDVATGKVKALVPNASRGWVLPSGHLIYGTSQGALFAVQFDAKALEIRSSPVGVLDGLNLTAGLLPQAAMSASGSIAYMPATANANAVVVQVDRAGREVPMIAKPGSYSQPRFSPDGRRLSLTIPDAKGANQIWVHDRASATTQQLTFEGDNARSTWSPDGNRIAFSAARGKSHLWWAPADGSGPGAAAGDKLELSSSAAVAWTRDGKWLVWDGIIVGQAGAGSDDIFATPMSGTDQKTQVVVATPAQEQSPDVSPDGKWVAYVSNDVGKNQVYMQPFLVPGGRTLVSAGSAIEPAWVSNNELVFVNTESDSVTLARFEFGATVKVTRTALFDRGAYQGGGSSLRGFDVSRDGKSFVFVKRTAQSVAIQPVVVLNWVEEVKRLMAAAGIK
jgi:Tol biopolymer transport system component/tRNA A-37 threonylcarbamoyl transferase component Bud32